MSDRIDDLISTLRSPAVPAELEGLPAAVAAMQRTLLDDLEPTMPAVTPITTRRRLPIATVVVCGILGFAGAAAAGPGGFLSDDAPETTATSTSAETTVVSTTVPETSVVTTSVPETPSSTSGPSTATPTGDALVPADGLADGPLVDDPDTEFDETLCADGNHGKTVSSVATATEPGPGHGATVSDAAKSQCGKTTDDGDDEGPDEVFAPGQGADVPNSGNGNGNGQSDQPNGNGNGNGQSDQPNGNSNGNGQSDQPHGNGNGNGNGQSDQPRGNGNQPTTSAPPAE
jgi:hypothetical protein